MMIIIRILMLESHRPLEMDLCVTVTRSPRDLFNLFLHLFLNVADISF